MPNDSRTIEPPLALVGLNLAFSLALLLNRCQASRILAGVILQVASRSMSHDPHLIFVYGSLMSDQFNYKVWPDRADDVQLAVIQADLFDLGPYPGIAKGTGRVLGELHYVSDAHWPNVIKTLDDFEEYYPDNPTASLYARQLVSAQTLEKTELAWTYFLSLEHLVAKLGNVFNSVENNETFLGFPCSSWSKYSQRSR